MVSITATNSANPPHQINLGRARLDQARREADQAEANAKNLRAQADDAERQAQSSQATVRRISASAQEETTTYSQPRGISTSALSLGAPKAIEQVYSVADSKRAQSGASLNAVVNVSRYVNIQGQVTGGVVNTHA